MDFAAFARDFGAMTATLIVGILGFTGVIATLRVNANVARQQRRDAIEHDRQTLRTALAAELTRAKGILEGLATVTSQATGPSFYVPVRPMTNVYDRHTDKLGLLNADEVRKVVDAYETLREMPLRLRLIERTMNAQGKVLDPDYIQIDGSLNPLIEASNKHHLIAINEAINALSGPPQGQGGEG